MEEASGALSRTEYFEAERLCTEALTMAHERRDYDRMARILLPLQEARRQKRDMAVESGRVFVVDDSTPNGDSLQAGCYLVRPPRVGVDGRQIREAADRARKPVVVAVREPMTRDGMWPVVAIGPVTFRAKVLPPGRKRRSTVRPGVKRSKRTRDALRKLDETVPPPEWFLAANEALGDAAIAEVNPSLPAEAKVEAYYERLLTHPDHEKLHQRLEEACREAASERAEKSRSAQGAAGSR